MPERDQFSDHSTAACLCKTQGHTGCEPGTCWAGPLGGALDDYREGWKARGRELNEIYDALTAVVEQPAPGMDPVADLKALGAQRDSLRAENERLREVAELRAQDGMGPVQRGAWDDLKAERDELRAGISWARGLCSDGEPHERIDHFLGCVLAGNAQLPPASDENCNDGGS